MIRALCLVVVLLAGAIGAQSAVDWADTVEKANTDARFALRRAAAKKVAAAGDAAIGALRTFAIERGAAAIDRVVVDELADSDGTGEATIGLLEEWATDRDFYWRSHALRGLARRAIGRCRELFRAALSDPSHLFRIEGARGLLALGEARPAVIALLDDADPRARLGVAMLLLERGDDAGLPEAVRALQRGSAFLDDPWGERLARRAMPAIREFAMAQGHDGDFGDRGDSVSGAAAMLAWARGRMPDAEFEPRLAEPIDAVGGLEIRSCRNGDLFVRWSAIGVIWFGLEPEAPAAVAAEDWRELRAGLPPLDPRVGTVICDFLRLQDSVAGVDCKVAPGALPPAFGAWLRALAQGIDEGGAPDGAAALRARLMQFSAGR